MRTLQIGTDPDSTILRTVTLPSSWSDDAARALAELTPPHDGPVRLAAEAARWVDMIDATPRLIQTEAEAPSVGRSLSCLLLMRHMAPNMALWQRQPDAQPGFVLRLSAFVQERIFAAEQFVACLELACESLRRLHASRSHERSGNLPLFGEDSGQAEETAGIIQLTDLDVMLAALGMDYDSDEARQFATAITALARIVTITGTGKPFPSVKVPLFPALEQICSAIVGSASGESLYSPVMLGFSSPGPVDVLLGVEACGLAPVFSPVDEEGQLRLSTLNRLACRNLTSERALALALSGIPPLPQPEPQAHTNMQESLADFVDYLPPRPEPEIEEAVIRLERGIRRLLPTRQGGFTQRTSIGGHRLFMQTSEFEDGTLGALNLTPSRETPMARGLMECLAQAVSIGLQFGAPLEAYVKQFAYTHFGPCGTVEGDQQTAYATSMLDYAFRTLSEAYLGVRMPDAPETDYPSGVQGRNGHNTAPHRKSLYEDGGSPMLPFLLQPEEPEKGDHDAIKGVKEKAGKKKPGLRLVG